MKKNIKAMSFAAMAALAMVSCSNHDDWMSYEDLKAAEYDAAFVKKYGTIDPNHTWGFGSATRAVTRGTLPGVADNPQNFPDIYNPEVFNDNQKEIVRLFFQNNKYLEGISYPYTEFFAQQIYKGNTKVGTQYGSASDCEEYYKAANDQWYAASDIMNEFEVKGQDGSFFHIDSFNNGDYARGNGTGMYAENADASEFRYTNSSFGAVAGSYVIIDGETIDTWAKGVGASILASQNISFESVATSKSQTPTGEVKETKRYYLGFDFRLLEGEETYTGQTINVAGKEYPCLSDNKNMYAGDKVTINNFNMVLGIINYPQNYNDQQKEQYAEDVKKLKEYLADGYLPVGQNGDLVKLGTVRNGYYSDWIISITPGKPETSTPEIPKKDPEYNEYGTPVSGRIFCEDLGSTGDFDFNDVVFDADIAEDNSTTIVLLAAGGIYDITVAGVHIHEVLGDGIVNTGVNEGLVKSYTITLSAAEATAMGISYAAGIGSIPVKVYATTDAGLFTEYELRNKVGGAPQKICVGKGTKWVKEYIDIVDAYPSFESWVQNYQTPNAFTDGVESNLYQY